MKQHFQKGDRVRLIEDVIKGIYEEGDIGTVLGYSDTGGLMVRMDRQGTPIATYWAADEENNGDSFFELVSTAPSVNSEVDRDGRFYFVWAPSRNIPKHKHATRELAVAEAKRLALANPGFEFIVLRAIASYQTVSNPTLRQKLF